MFIRETARTYGLRVDATEDQRLDVELETDAAMRLLVANRARFGSWELSLLAYNVGEQVVQRAIDQTGSRDVWVLIKAGAVNDHNYIAKVMAAAMILSNQNRLGVGN
jgi:membrane-bound lytic murein transglycosylase D